MDNDTLNDRCERIQFLQNLIDEHEFTIYPEFAFYYFEELKSTFTNGDFIATIILCQMICYEYLKWPYRHRGQAEIVDEYGFAKLIQSAVRDGYISTNMAQKMHRLRVIRNNLEHTKDYSTHDRKMLKLSMIIKGKELVKKTRYTIATTFQIMNELSWRT